MIRCNVFVLLHYYNFEEKVKKKQQKGLFEEKFQALFLGIVKNDYLCTRLE